MTTVTLQTPLTSQILLQKNRLHIDFLRLILLSRSPCDRDNAGQPAECSRFTKKIDPQQNSIQCCDITLEVDQQIRVWFQCLRGFHRKIQEQLGQDDVV